MTPDKTNDETDKDWRETTGAVRTKAPAGAAARTLKVRRERADDVSMDTSTMIGPTSVELSELDSAAAAVSLLGVVAEPVRWRLLTELAGGSRCVCELQPVGGVAPNLLSYHLRVLRQAGLVTATRRGRWIDYALAAGALDRLHTALPAAVGATTTSGCDD